MFKIFRCGLIILTVSSLFFAAGASAKSPIVKAFNDIDETHPNYDAILEMKYRGIINGYPDKTFGPNNSINRAELLTILYNMKVDKNAQTNVSVNCFPDLNGGEWYAAAVCYAKANNWVDGYSDGTFRANNPTNRAEATKIILNAYYGGPDKIPVLTMGQKTFLKMPLDVQDPSLWYYDLLLYAIGTNLYDMHHSDFNDDGSYTFNVGENMSRKEVAETIYRLLLNSEFDIASHESEFSGDWYYQTQKTVNSDGNNNLKYTFTSATTLNLNFSAGTVTGDFISTYIDEARSTALYITDGSIEGTYKDGDRGVMVNWEGSRNDKGSAYIYYDPVSRYIFWENNFESKDGLYNLPRYMRLKPEIITDPLG